MSSKYTDVSEVPTDVICKRLEELSHAVTVSDRKMIREFTMRVPVEVDRDADVVISEAARRLETAEAQLEQARVEYLNHVKATKSPAMVLNAIGWIIAPTKQDILKEKESER